MRVLPRPSRRNRRPRPPVWLGDSANGTVRALPVTPGPTTSTKTGDEPRDLQFRLREAGGDSDDSHGHHHT